MGNDVKCVQPKSDVKATKSLAAIGIFLALSIQVRAKPVFTVVRFYNLEDKQDSSWIYTIPFLIKLQLKEVQGIQVSPDASIQFGADDAVEFGYREAYKHGASEDFFRTVGQVVEADYVVQGTYGKETNSWLLTVSAIDVHKGVTYGPVTIRSPDLSAAICEAPKRLLEKIGLPLSVRAGPGAGQLVTKSFAALEQFSQAFKDLCFGRPVSEAEVKLRKSLIIDSHFTLGRLALGYVLGLEGKLDESAEVCKGVLVTRPEYTTPLELASAHFILGMGYRMREVVSEAEKEFLEANRLAPQEPYVLVNLGEIAFINEKYQEALRFLQEGKRVAPFISMLHQELARTYLATERRDEGLQELRLAERYDTGNNGLSILAFGQLYAELNETAKAVHYYEKFLAAVQRLGVQGSFVEETKEALAELKPRLEPHFVESRVPKSITAEELAKEVRRAALASKTQCSANPFEATAEMRKWAKQLVGNSTDDLEKAKLIFDALTQRSTTEIGEPHAETAEQAFRDLQKPGAYISCQDFTFLFIALARAVGLSAHYVSVSKDVRGTYVLHTCAGVFAEEKAILVDPAYCWFGVPHQEFAFHDDAEATGLFLCQSTNLNDQFTATNLAPRSAFVYFNLAMELASQKKAKQAKEAYDAGVRLKGAPWLTLATEGVLEYYDGKPKAAIDHLRQSLAMKPDFPTLHFELGQALVDARAFEKARDEFRWYVENVDNPEFADEAREQISYLDGVIKESDNDSKTVKAGGTGP